MEHRDTEQERNTKTEIPNRSTITTETEEVEKYRNNINNNIRQGQRIQRRTLQTKKRKGKQCYGKEFQLAQDNENKSRVKMRQWPNNYKIKRLNTERRNKKPQKNKEACLPGNHNEYKLTY